VVPVFGEIFSSFGAELPGPTKFLILLSKFVQKWLILILLGMGGAVLWLALFHQDAAGNVNSGIRAGSSCRSSAHRPQDLPGPV